MQEWDLDGNTGDVMTFVVCVCVCGLGVVWRKSILNDLFGVSVFSVMICYGFVIRNGFDHLSLGRQFLNFMDSFLLPLFLINNAKKRNTKCNQPECIKYV